MRCANPSCNHMVHLNPSFGGYCCKKCSLCLVDRYVTGYDEWSICASFQGLLQYLSLNGAVGVIMEVAEDSKYHQQT